MFLLQEKIDYSGNCFIQHPINLYTLTYLQDIGKDNPAVIYQFLKHFTFTMSRINGDFFYLFIFFGHEASIYNNGMHTLFILAVSIK